MLDAGLVSQLQGHLAKVTHPIELVMWLDESAKSAELARLLEQVASMSSLITTASAGSDRPGPVAPDGIVRRPAFAIHRGGTDIEVQFAGIPLGHELTSFVLALLQVGGHPPKVSADQAEVAAGLVGPLRFETYFSLSCQNCPDVVQALNALAVLNPSVRHVAIDGALFQHEVEARGVLAVPTVMLNGEVFGQGRMGLDEILAKLDTAAPARAAAALAERDPFDVLVVGGGPAGATAAMYAARKGITTGLVAERLGGQVLDTLGIENLPSVTYTDGPKLAAALEQQVRENDVDVMAGQRVRGLVPAAEPDGLITVELESAAALSARSVVLAPGARWRRMGVPGETEHLNRGVAFCPHCDGPLFRSKRVAVIGGGNSGVEAAIDLAGLASDVTLLEFADTLRADEVLQRSLRALPNVTVLTSAETTAVLGDGTKVMGLGFRDRVSGDEHEIALDGIFVQIGLLPNTEWLAGTVELSPRGEIVVDDRGRTSVPGVFAAGDATTVPFKQIVVAMGEGATAALTAFDHLVRTSPAALVPA